MSKRNNFIQPSPESLALKELREFSGLSVRKLADLLNISKTRVHQMESGREDVSEEYVRAFLKAIGLTWDSWPLKAKANDQSHLLREKCHLLIDSIKPSKLELIHGLLSNF